MSLGVGVYCFFLMVFTCFHQDSERGEASNRGATHSIALPPAPQLYMDSENHWVVDQKILTGVLFHMFVCRGVILPSILVDSFE